MLVDWSAMRSANRATRIRSIARDIVFGLRLPGVIVEPDTGSGHRDHCLQVLALYQSQ